MLRQILSFLEALGIAHGVKLAGKQVEWIRNGKPGSAEIQRFPLRRGPGNAREERDSGS